MQETVKPRKTGRSVSLMVWGSFAGGIRGPFLIFNEENGSITSQYYLQQMQEILSRFMEYVADTLDVNTIFMQDNALIHKAEIVKNWLQEQDFIVMEWPPYSSDLNPIKHVWPMLKAALQQQHSELASMKGGSNAIKEKMAEILPDVWRSLSLKWFQTLCESMP